MILLDVWYYHPAISRFTQTYRQSTKQFTMRIITKFKLRSETTQQHELFQSKAANFNSSSIVALLLKGARALRQMRINA